MLIFEDSGGFFFLFPCRILVTQPDIEPVSPALGTQAHNHWTAREVSTGGFFTCVRGYFIHYVFICNKIIHGT